MTATDHRPPGRAPRPAAPSGDVFVFVLLALAAAMLISWACAETAAPAVARWVIGAVAATAVVVVGARSAWVRR